jgi:phosphatidylglycerophosphatase A
MKTANVHKVISTVLGLGYFPIAPGTAGSLAGLVLCLILHGNLVLYSIVFILLFAAGVVSSGKAEAFFGDKDPSMVVIDEFACIFMVYMLVPLSVSRVVIGFLLFRIMDITKIPPMKSLENLKGGWGIMLDDLMAGIYSNLALQVLIALNIL